MWVCVLGCGICHIRTSTSAYNGSYMCLGATKAVLYESCSTMAELRTNASHIEYLPWSAVRVVLFVEMHSWVSAT